MPSYLYECATHGEFEETHSITTELTECPKCKEEGKEGVPVKRLICSGGGFILSGGGWARSGYS